MGESVVPSTHPTPGPPGREAHTGQSRRDHLTVTSVGTGELEPPGVETGHRHVSIHSNRRGGPNNLTCGLRGGGGHSQKFTGEPM